MDGKTVPLAVAPFVVTSALWLLLSGYFEPLMLTFGLLSCLLVVWLALRLKVIHPGLYAVGHHLRLFSYVPWLIKEIVISNIDVAKRIWNPRLPISPTMVRAKASQKTRLGLTTHANSITLTPGTLAVAVEEDEGVIIVHGLSREVTEGVIDSEMNRRCSWVEGQD